MKSVFQHLSGVFCRSLGIQHITIGDEHFYVSSIHPHPSFIRLPGDTAPSYAGTLSELLQMTQCVALDVTEAALQTPERFDDASRQASVRFLGLEKVARECFGIDTGHGRIYLTPTPPVLASEEPSV